MSQSLHRNLQFLEEDYAGQPPAVQQTDLREINRIRSRLGMPLVDAHLNEIAAAVIERVKEEAKSEPQEVRDHVEAREVYQAYLKKVEELEAHRAYAEQVAEATNSRGQTPVRPLATMGSNGGPLLCDHCRKPIVLEGGGFHGVTADVAWKDNPKNNWKSWIHGGMVVEIQTNGTLRIYHGYPGRSPKHCCNIANREEEKARAAFDASRRFKNITMIFAFIEQEFKDMAKQYQTDLLNNILDTMYNYDPGFGINRPSDT